MEKKLKDPVYLRDLEIELFLITLNIQKLTPVPQLDNIEKTFEFFKNLNLTSEINFDILKDTMILFATSGRSTIIPTRSELLYFAHRHTMTHRTLARYIKITAKTKSEIIKKIEQSPFYHIPKLQDKVYPQIEMFLEFIDKLSNIGVHLK